MARKENKMGRSKDEVRKNDTEFGEELGMGNENKRKSKSQQKRKK